MKDRSESAEGLIVEMPEEICSLLQLKGKRKRFIGRESISPLRFLQPFIVTITARIVRDGFHCLDRCQVLAGRFAESLFDRYKM